MFSDFFWTVGRMHGATEKEPRRTRVSLHFNTRRRRRWLLVQWVTMGAPGPEGEVDGGEGGGQVDGSRFAATALPLCRQFPDPAPGLSRFARADTPASRSICTRTRSLSPENIRRTLSAPRYWECLANQGRVLATMR